jgi:WYL_2, Sm-like SH3 beta-barrel fold
MDKAIMNMWDKQEMVRLLKGAPGTQYQEADDANKTIMRDWVKSLLNKQEITVKFVKADGTDRDMKCTLNWDLIPPQPQKPATAIVDGVVVESAKKSRKEPKEADPAVIKVYDLEAQAWRSFRMDRLKKITAELAFD